MNMMMHGITSPNIDRTNTQFQRDMTNQNYYDVVLANPPFSGSIDESEISDNFRIKTKKTEILFLELTFNILRSGGRCCGYYT